MQGNSVIFTDLDGTLLEYRSYSFKPALPALRFVKSKNIPLVICTSKTRAEIEFYRNLLDNNDPFISENGGGIFIPEGYFSDDFDYDKKTEGYKVIELGTRHGVLVEALSSLRDEAGLNVKGFSEMTVSEISEISGLSNEFAELAKTREYDEPFIIYGDERDNERIRAEINRMGFNHTEGGIFHHIMGKSDKGKAVSILTRLFKQKFCDLQTIGIGDSLNDLPMLESVDIPILVKKPNGEYDRRIQLNNLVLAEGIGPEGWNKAVLNLFERNSV
ncbi:MAG TPA: mannosyl-3-phosphoglycerate phosphatase [Thermodesulfobacteriota bacterium]|nr:mannosyl-3-phosphoglycerate phosphatase [Thermodesulfobacteriota bacterium]